MVKFFTVGMNSNGTYPVDERIKDIQYTEGTMFCVSMMEPKESVYLSVPQQQYVFGKKYVSKKALYDGINPLVIPYIIDAVGGTDGLKVFVSDANEKEITIGIENTSDVNKNNILVSYVMIKAGGYEVISENVEKQHLRTNNIIDIYEVLKNRREEE